MSATETTALEEDSMYSHYGFPESVSDELSPDSFSANTIIGSVTIRESYDLDGQPELTIYVFSEDAENRIRVIDAYGDSWKVGPWQEL